MLVYEQEVLNLVARGLTDAQIAYSMQVCPQASTVCLITTTSVCFRSRLDVPSNLWIGSSLWRQITQAGVRNALTKLMTSFKADTRCELVRIALDNDLITE
jgi:DNA-binding NarL/FixJ family response regulator